jgi:uncharacterized protein (TIGR03067 family)
MILRMFAVAIALLALTHDTQAADDDAIKKEMEKIQGNWKVTSFEIQGKVPTDVDIAKIAMTIKGDRYTVNGLGPNELTGVYKIVEVKGKTRKADLREQADKEPVLLTIAEWIDDDSFRTCLDASERPTRFASSGAEGGVGLIVFKRVKK